MCHVLQIFTEGISNKLIGYSVAGQSRDVVIFKIYGAKTEDMIDRNAEIETMNVNLNSYCWNYSNSQYGDGWSEILRSI